MSRSGSAIGVRGDTVRLKADGREMTVVVQTALNEELTFSDAEIDAFLPAPLRRTT